MWLMTTRGFYSAVQHREDPTKILVRARCEEDIRALSDLIDAEPFPLTRSDYEWRLECSLAEWTFAVCSMSLEIDYPNFKNAVKARQGSKRSGVYMKVWSALLALEKRWPAKPKQLPLPRAGAGGRLIHGGLLCDCWMHADEGDPLDHDIDCPYSLELEAIT